MFCYGLYQNLIIKMSGAHAYLKPVKNFSSSPLSSKFSLPSLGPALSYNNSHVRLSASHLASYLEHSCLLEIVATTFTESVETH